MCWRHTKQRHPGHRTADFFWLVIAKLLLRLSAGEMGSVKP